MTTLYYSTEQAGGYLNIPHKTLNVMRCRGDGPKFAKLGRKVIYRQQDLDAWVISRLKYSTSE